MVCDNLNRVAGLGSALAEKLCARRRRGLLAGLSTRPMRVVGILGVVGAAG